jgi:GNAT superfamily N-acetyltransferase
MEIVKLDLSQRTDILDVLNQAFAAHPVMTPDTSIQTTEAMLELIIDTFGHHDNAFFYGIREEGGLACVSFSMDARYGPRGLALIAFFLRLLRILGWRLMRQFIRTFSERPHYAHPYLDLSLLATVPAYQGTGLGTTMLRFLYDLAREKGYHGIVLVVVKGSSAYHLYSREGFINEKDMQFGNMVLAHMRRDNA